MFRMGLLLSSATFVAIPSSYLTKSQELTVLAGRPAFGSAVQGLGLEARISKRRLGNISLCFARQLSRRETLSLPRAVSL